MKALPQTKPNLEAARKLIVQLPLDAAQRQSVACTLAAQSDEVVERFVEETGEALSELKRLNAQVAALHLGLEVAFVRDPLPARAVCGGSYAGS